MDLQVKNPKTLGKKRFSMVKAWAYRKFMMPKKLKKPGMSCSFIEIQH